MTQDQPRTPAGSPEGGQFSGVAGAETSATLGAATPTGYDETFERLVAARVKKGASESESRRLLAELTSAHDGVNLESALVYQYFCTERVASKAVAALASRPPAWTKPPSEATLEDIAEVRAVLSLHSAATPDARAWLLDAEESMASDMGTSVPELSALASSTFWVVRDKVARHPATSTQTLAQLAEDISPDVRCSVAGNRNTPVMARQRLASDHVESVRDAAR